MTTEDRRQPRLKREKDSKDYRISHSWIDIIPGYTTLRQAQALSKEERDKLLRPFQRPRFPLPDLPPLARIRLFKQDILGAESINRFDYWIQDPRPIPDIEEEWKLEKYIQNKRREWYILGGAERERNKQGSPFYLNLWANLDTIDLIQSERFALWEKKAGRIQYEYRTKVSPYKGRYLIFYCINSSGYNTGPFNREFHRKQVRKELNTSAGS
jgi:hypothetical protein